MDKRTCGTYDVHERLLKTETGYKEKYERISAFTNDFARSYVESFDKNARVGPVIIPVVVHVVYNTDDQNISDAQIESQIKVLNEDFRKLNADVNNTPSDFKSVVADAQVQFQLAVRDPDCKQTNGITRTKTSVTTFKDDDRVKSAATGGHDPWPRDKYLNIWICGKLVNSKGQTLLGYATFPGAPAKVDGVVINYKGFGNIGTAQSPYNKGRTATHEIGHWLDLHHIWGDDYCGDDGVVDTPTHNDPNYGCPTYPHKSTCSGEPVEMTMNYMDYTDDGCMYMFTAGQVARINATLYGPRNAILSSDGLIPAPATPNSDLFSQDTPKDVGDEPDVVSTLFYISDDIYIRRQDDGLQNQEHQNPLYGKDNYVYVRVRNRGCLASNTGVLKLYWAKASTALGWPAPWDGSITTPALMGGLIGSQNIGQVAGGGFKILKFKWSPPDPELYSSFGGDKTHFCLLSRIETSTNPPYGMTFPESGNLVANVKNNNNIVWKNVTIAEEENKILKGYVTLVNPLKKPIWMSLKFKTVTKEGRKSIFDVGKLYIDMPKEMFKQIKDVHGMKVRDDKFEIIKPQIQLDKIKLPGGEMQTIAVQFKPKTKLKEYNTFYFDVEQSGVEFKEDVPISKFKLMGGQRFVIMTTPR